MCRRQIFDLFGAVAHRDQLGHRDDAAVRNIVRRLDVLTLARDQELLGRHSLDLHAAIWAHIFDCHTVDHWGHDKLAGVGVDLRLADSLRRLHSDFRVRVGGECCKCSIVEAGQVIGLDFGLVFPETLDDADLADQCVFECRMHRQEAVVVAVHDEICVVSRLLSRLDILWAGGDI